jgi:hypothetical protein
MNRKFMFFALVLGTLAVVVASCNNESEENRAVVIVPSINENAPFFSDVMDQGDTLYVGGLPYTVDDFIREDFVPIAFYNRPYNAFTTTGPGDPLSDFLITRYRVEWRRADGGPADEVPPTYDGATSIMVPSNTIITGYVLLVPAEVKNMPFMQDINYLHKPTDVPPGNWPDEYLMIAHFTFWGHEVGTKREWSFEAELSVNFADPVVESEDDL